jgi:hypothetical protein
MKKNNLRLFMVMHFPYLTAGFAFRLNLIQQKTKDITVQIFNPCRYVKDEQVHFSHPFVTLDNPNQVSSGIFLNYLLQAIKSEKYATE